MAVRSAMERLFRYSPEQDDSFQLIGYGAATSAGAAGGTTLIDAGGVATSGSANTYNGRYWVKCLDGNNENLWKRVVDDDGSGTLTLEGNGFPNQVASGTLYALCKSSEAVVVVTTKVDTDNAQDTVRDEANDYWNGYYMTPISGTEANQIQEVTDFVSASGNIETTGSFDNALEVGDVCMLSQYLEVGNVTSSPTEEYHPRLSKRVNFSIQDGVVGPRGGTISFDVQAIGSGTLAGDTAKANLSAMHGLFQACGLTEYIGTTTKIDDAGVAGTTTSLKIDTATHENFKIGQAIMWAGNVSFITAKTDGGGSADTLTVSPALPISPLDNNVVYASRMYYFDTDAQRKGVTLYLERDGIRETYFECKGNLEIVVGDASEVIFRYNMTYSHYIREMEDEQANPSSAYSTAKIIHGKDRLCYLDTTATDMKGITTTPGAVATMKTVSGKYGVNGTSGLQHTDYAPGATFTALWEDADDGMPADEWWGTRDSKAVTVVCGSHGDCIAMRLPVARLTQAPVPVEDENMMAESYNVTGMDAGVVTDPANGTEKLPDWILCIF